MLLRGLLVLTTSPVVLLLSAHVSPAEASVPTCMGHAATIVGTDRHAGNDRISDPSMI